MYMAYPHFPLKISPLLISAESALKDIYSLNFKSYSNVFCSYFLALFPVFTLRYIGGQAKSGMGKREGNIEEVGVGKG